ILVVNDAINTKFNEFKTTKQGLVGTKQGSVEKFNLDYDKIRADNFGHNCAFWYKNIKINERGTEFNEAIKDNNCCFRFYYGPERKKIELCVFVPGDGVCVKKSRELMKSLKEGCLLNTGNFPPDDKKKGKDSYNDETFDDNRNGIFHGFVHVSDVFKPSVLPQAKPKYIKISKQGIKLYDSFDDTETQIALQMDDLMFNCDGYSPCSPKGFKSYAGTNKAYIPNLAAITGVYNNYLTMFTKIKKTFDQDCFVLESNKKISYFVCPYNIAHASSIKKAIVEAFTLSYSCKILNDVENANPDDTFNLIVKGQNPKMSVTAKVTGKGLINTKDNKVIFDYLNMARDPETKQRCAIWFKDIEIPF
ncbi:MAG: hypothetical protein GY861_25165, partial [bacterium]|nr:hypothetical protein [bacterium]